MPAFLDTSVLIHLLSGDASRADRAEELVAAGPTISVQVLNEFVAVARRKLALSWDEIEETLAVVRAACAIEPLTLDVFDQARRLAPAYQLSWYDALIVSAALSAGCTTLYSEDMHPGLRIDRTLTLRNPFEPLRLRRR